MNTIHHHLFYIRSDIAIVTTNVLPVHEDLIKKYLQYIDKNIYDDAVKSMKTVFIPEIAYAFKDLSIDELCDIAKISVVISPDTEILDTTNIHMYDKITVLFIMAITHNGITKACQTTNNISINDLN